MSPSATPATQNKGGCEQVPRLPRETPVDVAQARDKVACDKVVCDKVVCHKDGVSQRWCDKIVCVCV